MPCEANPVVFGCPGPNQPTVTAPLMCPHCKTHSCQAPNRSPDCRGPNGPGVGLNGILMCGVCKGKSNIRDRRGSIARMVGTPGMTAAQLQAAWTQRAVVIVQDLYTEAFGVAG